MLLSIYPHATPMWLYAKAAAVINKKVMLDKHTEYILCLNSSHVTQ